MGDLESRYDQSFSSHGECVVTVFFCEMAAAIRRNVAIASDIWIVIDEGIGFSDGNGGRSPCPNRSRRMLR